MSNLPRSLRFNTKEIAVLRRLSTPQKIQDFLNTLPFNFEKNGETCRSPRRVLRDKTAHCLEGALFAATALWFHGERPLLMDIKAVDPDFDHVVTLFRKFGRWGAISKTNHAVLRYREPVYKTPRELAMSYFHEYFLNDGRKTMRSFSKPFDLSYISPPRVGGARGGTKSCASWPTGDHDLWYISHALDVSPHEHILTPAIRANLRRAEKVEIDAGKLVEWKKPRTK